MLCASWCNPKASAGKKQLSSGSVGSDLTSAEDRSGAPHRAAPSSHRVSTVPRPPTRAAFLHQELNHCPKSASDAKNYFTNQSRHSDLYLKVFFWENKSRRLTNSCQKKTGGRNSAVPVARRGGEHAAPASLRQEVSRSWPVRGASV